MDDLIYEARHKKNASFREFAETTSITGVIYAYRGSKVDKCFWSILILVAFGFTVKDLASLVVQYYKEDTVTVVSRNHNDSVTLPDPALCYRMHTMDLWSTLGGMRLNITKLSTVTVVLKYFDGESDIVDYLIRTSELKVLTDEHAAFLVLVTYMFYSIAYVESTMTSYWLEENPSVLNATWSEFMDYPSRSSDAERLGRSIVATRNYLVRRNVDFERLRYAITLTWLQQTQLKFFKHPDDIGEPLLSMNISVVWFGIQAFMEFNDHYICFRIADSYKYLTFDSNTADRYFWVYYLQPPLADYTNQESYGFRALDLVFSNARTATTEQWDNAIADWVWSNSAGNFLVTYLQKHKSVNLLRRPCSETTTFFDCKGSCQARFLVNYCGCYPTTWSWDGILTRPHDVPLCGLKKQNVSGLYIEDLESCRSELVKNYPALKYCMHTCLHDCETSTFSFQYVHWSSYDYYVGIRLTSFEYNVLEERLAMSNNDFIANIGGILGVWTGGCALAYVHVMIFLVKWLFMRCLIKRLNKRQKMTPAANGHRNYLESHNDVQHRPRLGTQESMVYSVTKGGKERRVTMPHICILE